MIPTSQSWACLPCLTSTCLSWETTKKFLPLFSPHCLWPPNQPPDLQKLIWDLGTTVHTHNYSTWETGVRRGRMILSSRPAWVTQKDFTSKEICIYMHMYKHSFSQTYIFLRFSFFFLSKTLFSYEDLYYFIINVFICYYHDLLSSLSPTPSSSYTLILKLWLKLAILATWEAELGRITVRGQPGDKFARSRLNQCLGTMACTCHPRYTRKNK
jgi:hypothetical protein